MLNPKMDMFIEFFNNHGIKFVDIRTNTEIKPSGEPLKKCFQCDSDIPISATECMWCKREQR